MASRSLKRGTGPAVAALVLAAVAALAAGLSGIGAQSGWWSPEAAVGALPAIIAASVIALLVGLYARFRRRDGQLVAVLAVLIALLVAGSLGQYLWRSARAPGLIDISTDLHQPPEFTVLSVRRDRLAHVPLPDRPGYAALSREERWRAVHVDAHADLRPILVAASPAEVVEKVQALARANGWTMVAADPGAGRLELTVPSPFFAFQDDLVLRARRQGDRTRVDLRGIARRGTADGGRIARQIRRVQGELTDER